jgi:hypothetical protein
VVNLGDASVFLALSSVCIAMLYGAYLMVTGPMLVRRLRGQYRAARPGEFSLGRFGIAINAIAVVYGVLMMINLAWPRAEVYDVAGGHWYLQWFAPLFMLGAVVLGAAVFAWLRARRAAAMSASASAPVSALHVELDSDLEGSPA